MQNQQQPIITLKNIRKSFSNVEVLKGINLTLFEGEIFALVGENGAGKSTLMKILSGMHPAGSYSGEIYVNGKQGTFNSVHDAHTNGIAMIYQEINLNLDLSIAENVFVGRLKNKGGFVDWKALYRETEVVLKTLGLDVDVKMRIRNLNAGMKQIVTIARALVVNPHVLILDEPTSSLTSAEVDNLIKVLNKLKERGIICLYISHKLDEVFAISDRVGVLRDGVLVSIYEKKNFDAESIVEDLIGRKLGQMYPYTERKIGEVSLKVENLVLAHPQAKSINIVDGISFHIRKGEIVGFAGLVGSGRSEIIRAVYGLLPKKEGEVYVNGKHVEINNPKQAQKLGISMLTEDRKHDGYIAQMDIKKNMTLGILNKLNKRLFIDRNKEVCIANDYLDSLGIKAPSIDTNIMSLSGGNQQKVLIGKCLVPEPSILLLDEPTRGVDIGAKKEIYNIIMDLAAKGMSIVIISSELPELCNICDRFIVLARGKVVGERDKSEVDEAKILRMTTMLE